MKTMIGSTPNPQRAESVATVATPNAKKYLVQLCKHFQHKLPASWGDDVGQIAFSIGECRLSATDHHLDITADAPDSENLSQLEDVIARHLVRFAFREALTIDWRREAAGPA